MATIAELDPPKYLYRFRGLGFSPSARAWIADADPNGRNDRAFDREMSAIRDQYVWGSSFEKMNDAMEGLFGRDREIPRSPEWDQAAARIRQGKADIGIICFNESPSDEVMWAHYADSFYGICIAYNTRRLLEGLEERSVLTRVSYQEQYPRIRFEHNANDLGAAVVAILSKKSSRWSYEREWRILGRHERNYFENKAVQKVYIGSRLGKAEIQRTRRALDRMDIEWEQITIRNYKIELTLPD
jgi:hypothetical protein